MNKLDLDYQNLLKDIIENGVEKKDRTGTGTISVFGRQIRHKMSEGFPLLTTKKIHFKSIVSELLWFLQGRTDLKWLLEQGNTIWVGDAYKNYVNKIKLQNNWEVTLRVMDINTIGQQKLLSQEEFINKIKTDDEFAKKWGELGPIYGKQWRDWEGYPEKWRTQDRYGNWMWQTTESGNTRQIDQIQNLINDLKTNPDSRRLMVSAWNVGELDSMVLPPCHYGFQVYTRELSLEERMNLVPNVVEKITEDDLKNYIEDGGDSYNMSKMLDDNNVPKRAISLMWNQRSVDTFLGLPFNIASYGLLLEIIAKAVNMVPDELIGNLGDVHLYSNHIEQAKEQIGRKLTVEERMDWWFKNRKPNRDVCDDVDAYSPYAKGVYFDSIGVPKTTREPYPLPTVTLPSGLQPGSGNWDKLVFEDFYLNNYQSHPTIKAPLSN